MHNKTDDSILMRRHRDVSLEPIYPMHIEPMRRYFSEDTGTVDLRDHLMLIGGSSLFVGLLLAIALWPHH